jgi:hypothetical protein
MFPFPSGLLGDPGLLTVPLIHNTRFGFVAARIPSCDCLLVIAHDLIRVLTDLIHIANSPTLGNIKMDRNIGSVEVAPAIWGICRDPLVR